MLALALDKVGIFYAAQNKNAQAKAAFERANAIRANSLAAGLSSEASQVRAAGDLAAAGELYARALRVLDPPNDIYNATRDASRPESEGRRGGDGGESLPKKTLTKK